MRKKVNLMTMRYIQDTPIWFSCELYKDAGLLNIYISSIQSPIFQFDLYIYFLFLQTQTQDINNN